MADNCFVPFFLGYPCRRHTTASMEPAQLTAAVVSIVNISRIILEYVQHLAKRHQHEDDCEEDMDIDIPESTGCGNWDIMAAVGLVDTVEYLFWARQTKHRLISTTLPDSPPLLHSRPEILHPCLTKASGMPFFSVLRGTIVRVAGKGVKDIWTLTEDARPQVPPSRRSPWPAEFPSLPQPPQSCLGPATVVPHLPSPDAKPL
ncbi:hypothetical protein UY3_01574 [Chelonia mydas]|uniref:Uncharacterized protein n=1 Tax=Chelonia mydas TaxID=8469 RepID=M7BTI9_CHEMY|nr:hypothetical protein UY3_01574 [Chelonia mydas]